MKVHDLSVLGTEIRKQHQSDKVVLCHGAFDLLHVGHLKHLEAAKRHGDVLVVTATADEYIN